MARFTNLIIILITLDILFAAGGFISPKEGTTACWLSVASNGNFDGCSIFTSGLGVISGFLAGTVIVGLFLSSRIEQMVSGGFVTSLMAFIIPDIAIFYQKINDGLSGYFGGISVYIAAIFIAPIIVMSFFIIYDWWRSPIMA